MINKKQHDELNINQSCDYYSKLGCKGLTVATPLGKRLFQSPVGNEVIRIGQDPCYDIFASAIIMDGTLTLINAVTILDQYRVNRTGGSMYTNTEMEHLNNLTNQEILNLDEWKNKIIGNLTPTVGACDPFNL